LETSDAILDAGSGSGLADPALLEEDAENDVPRPILKGSVSGISVNGFFRV
jgi:hypothetical protein